MSLMTSAVLLGSINGPAQSAGPFIHKRELFRLGGSPVKVRLATLGERLLCFRSAVP